MYFTIPLRRLPTLPLVFWSLKEVCSSCIVVLAEIDFIDSKYRKSSLIMYSHGHGEKMMSGDRLPGHFS